jgi:uncharacterized protein (UPF0216 family)
VHGEEGAFRRWMRFELDTLHAGLVTQRRSLAELLKEASPSAPARGGGHAFDPAELRRLDARLDLEQRYRLRLPMHLYASGEVEDALYTLDAAVAETMVRLGYARGKPDAQGKVWVARALALAALRDWPTCVQFVYL